MCALQLRKGKGVEKHDRVLFSKLVFIFQISQRSEKKIAIDPVITNWVNFIKKESGINCSRNSMSFNAIHFYGSINEVHTLI